MSDEPFDYGNRCRDRAAQKWRAGSILAGIGILISVPVGLVSHAVAHSAVRSSVGHGAESRTIDGTRSMQGRAARTCENERVIRYVSGLGRRAQASIAADQKILSEFYNDIGTEFMASGFSHEFALSYQRHFASLVPIYCFSQDIPIAFDTHRTLDRSTAARVDATLKRLKEKHPYRRFYICSDCSAASGWNVILYNAKIMNNLHAYYADRDAKDVKNNYISNHHNMTLMTIGLFLNV